MNLTLIKGMRLVVATHNAGKAVEIDALLGGHYTVVTAASLNLPEPDETMVSVSERQLDVRFPPSADGPLPTQSGPWRGSLLGPCAERQLSGQMRMTAPEGFQKSQYRRFNIRGEDLIPGGDYGMVREVMRRRFGRLVKDEGTNQPLAERTHVFFRPASSRG